jgi:hypothetical protein
MSDEVMLIVVASLSMMAIALAICVIMTAP